MEKIISRWRPQSPEASLRQLEEFVSSIKSLPIREAEQAIAEKRFRKPVILFDRWAIRPFWKDGRKAPLRFEKVKRI
ncbi:MAG: hypothetical protein A3D74_05325 [Candidatus Levybacteria bacterium RIFCSPHIGHO2_02_FULL_37_13]|nr:MAG: hypothetical protein A3D74_05325 [Candidatus Levybacteria bacterium RIFCSPHIGHO2_02_FULL_37_13]OGH29933.1 MAG: hypothetical protein A3E40_04575 [Candidatus Levybacteria bacterium RIFCSPHIGHO2_12_FULL_37_9]OGH39742.1 MAG: hypothetical protein A3B41_00825 [Candidatus Levybacteria bacterium RIFCSPLOWO2_01_FULL_37_26]